MNSYLLTLVLKPDLDEKERKALLDLMKKNLTIKKEDLWGVKDLSYPIKKQTKGFYVHMEVEAEPQIAKTIDKTLKVEDDILRYLLVRV